MQNLNEITESLLIQHGFEKRGTEGIWIHAYPRLTFNAVTSSLNYFGKIDSKDDEVHFLENREDDFVSLLEHLLEEHFELKITDDILLNQGFQKTVWESWHSPDNMIVYNKITRRLIAQLPSSKKYIPFSNVTDEATLLAKLKEIDCIKAVDDVPQKLENFEIPTEDIPRCIIIPTHLRSIYTLLYEGNRELTSSTTKTFVGYTDRHGRTSLNPVFVYFSEDTDAVIIY